MVKKTPQSKPNKPAKGASLEEQINAGDLDDIDSGTLYDSVTTLIALSILSFRSTRKTLTGRRRLY